MNRPDGPERPNGPYGSLRQGYEEPPYRSAAASVRCCNGIESQGNTMTVQG